jgi:uncharacterized spore protein YtfJ
MDTTTLKTTTPDLQTTLVALEGEALRTNRVHGEPITAHGVTLVTAARIGGGAGGGSGQGPGDQGEGAGAGFTGRPVGAYVLSEGTVRWQPAVDVNRLLLVGAVVALAALLTARRIARSSGPADRYLH